MPKAPEEYVVKGSVVRAYLAALAKLGHDKATLQVLANDDAATAEVMRNPPLAGTWTDALVLARIVAAVHRVGGDPAVLAVARGALKEAPLQSLVPMVQNLLKVFGASPAFLLKRYDEFFRVAARGFGVQYTPLSDRSGTIQMEHRTSVPLPAASYLTTVPSLEYIVGLCGVRASVSMPEVVGHNTARYLIRW